MPRYNKSPNPSAATATTGWLGTGTQTRLTGLSGPPRTTGVSTPSAAGSFSASLGCAPATASSGQTWTAVGWVRNSVARMVRVGLITWQNGTFVSAGGTGSTDVALAANTWTQIRVTGTLGSGTFNQVNFHVDLPTTGTSGTLSVSSCRVEQVTDLALVYADGDSGSGWDWDGTTGNSTSTQPDSLPVDLADPAPAAALVSSPAGESFEALTNIVDLDDPAPAGAAASSPGRDTIDVTIADTVSGQAQVGSAGGERVDVAVNDPRASSIVASNPGGEQLFSNELLLPDAGRVAVAFFVVDRDTDELTPLPHQVGYQVSPTRNSPGAVQIDYPKRGLNADELWPLVDDDVQLECEIWFGNRSAGAKRVILTEGSADDVAETALGTFTGQFLECLLAGIQLRYNPDDPEGKGETTFAAVSPGTFVATLMGRADARGTLTGAAAITYDTFTATHDSAGNLWTETITGTFSPGSTLLDLFQDMAEGAVFEFEVTAARELKIYTFGSRGRDRTVGDAPAVLRRGQNVKDASRKRTSRAAVTDLEVYGKDGLHHSEANLSARARYGRPIEGSASAGEIDAQGPLDAFAEKTLQLSSTGQLEITCGLMYGVGAPTPVNSFDVGDQVLVDLGLGTVDRPALEPYRVAEWSLRDSGGDQDGTITVNDRLTDLLSRIRRRLDRMQRGGVIIGTSTSPAPEDTTPPKAPTGLSQSSIAYQDDVDAQTYASVTISWTAVTEDINNVAENVAGYRVRYAYVGLNQVGGIPSSDPFPENDLNYYEATDNTGTPNTTFSFGGVGAGSDVRVEVRAFDQAGNEGEWSAPLTFTTEVDNTPPGVPSRPSAEPWFATVNANWDGTDEDGAVMREAFPDFDHIELHMGLSNGFTVVPEGISGSTFITNLYAAGPWNVPNLSYGVGVFFRLVAVDRAGNRSDPSLTSAVATPQQLVSQDLIDDIIDATKLGPNSVESQHVVNAAITSAKILDAAIVTAKIADLAVNTAKIADLDVGRLTTGTLFATVTLSGIIRTNTTGARSEIDAAGIRLYNGAGTLTVRLQTSDGSALVTGTYQSGLSGERINILPDGTFRFYPAAGANYSQIANFGNDVVWRGPLDANQRSGRVNVNVLGVGMNFSAESEIPNNLRSEMIVTDRQARTTAPLIVLELNGKLTVPAGSNRRLELRATNSSGTVLTPSLLYYTARSGDNLATWGGNNSGFVFDSKIVVTTGNATTFGAIGASSFDPPSSGTVKDNIADARADLDPLETIRNARSKRWNYAWEHFATPPATDEDPNPEPVPVEAPVRFGPIAEDLPPVLVTDVVMPDGSGAVPGASLGSLIGVLWGALGQVLDQRLVQTTADVPLPARLNANTDYDVTVPWAEGEAQTVPVPVSLTPMGPTNLQLRALTASVVAITKAGVTVRFRAKRLIIGLDAEDHYVATAVHSFIPPYVPEEEAA